MAPKMYRKVYVQVNLEVDPDGRIFPRALVWEDGTVFPIQRVKQVRRAPALKAGGMGDRYTVTMNGQDRELFFEHNPITDSEVLGKWFVEQEIQRG